jgi:hypothetical protein
MQKPPLKNENSVEMSRRNAIAIRVDAGRDHFMGRLASHRTASQQFAEWRLRYVITT